MSLPANPKAILLDVISQGRAVIVSGTGVSIAASQFHPQASWTGLLDNGLTLLGKHSLITDDKVKAHRELLSSSPATAQFIATAQAITCEMSPKMFRSWLKDTVGDIKAKDAQVLDVLEDMRQLKNLLATTNYDGLLLEGRSGLVPITWHDKAAFLSAYRNRDHDKVLFLHGYWDVPESVILDERSYQEIARDEDYRQKLAAMWMTSTWVYVGCGESGLTDPDLGLLLDVYGQRARDDGHWDFLLALNTDVARLQDFFNRQKVNICVVGYGEIQSDLVPFLRSLLPSPASAAPAPAPSASPANPILHSSIPQPPAFYAEPDYIGSHQFVGRQAELDALSDWANRSDPTNLLLFEAIGGNGKSMLNWEWCTKHATKVRNDWAGRFWYSFYERGAIMQDFCQRALSYMTGRPLNEFETRKTAELKDELISQLHARPWLLILDGLERVLVHYHCIDAAEVPDEEANTPTDRILSRNPCDAIRDEDGDIIRALSASAPSKILVSTRLTPRILLNPAGQPIPGAKRVALPGLRPPDAEALLRQCGITGNSAAIQHYLQQNFDNHPLLIGVLAGLVVNHLPDRGNFDAWCVDHNGGGAFDLGKLDLSQRSHHILAAALKDLQPASQQLLSTVALCTGKINHDLLKAVNPHQPKKPAELKRPEPPYGNWETTLEREQVHQALELDLLEDSEREQLLEKAALEDAYYVTLAHYEQEFELWKQSAPYREAPAKLAETMNDLQSRNLLQYDAHRKVYDLHPLIRGVVVGQMDPTLKQRCGQKVIDYYSAKRYDPFLSSITREDLEPSIELIRVLIKLGRFKDAAAHYRMDLSNALIFAFDSPYDLICQLKPFFAEGWAVFPAFVDYSDAVLLSRDIASALVQCGEHQPVIELEIAAVRRGLVEYDWRTVSKCLAHCSQRLVVMGRLAKGDSINRIALQFAEFLNDNELVVLCQHNSAALQSISEGNDAEVSREHRRATQSIEPSNLLQSDLERFSLAVRVARERHLVDAVSETALAITKVRLGNLTCDEARSEAERLAGLRDPAHRILALLWLALGDRAKAEHHALAAYRWAWADGEPYVNRYELTKTTELLNSLGVPIPNLPPYDPAKDELFPWEADVRAAIEKLKAQKAEALERRWCLTRCTRL